MDNRNKIRLENINIYLVVIGILTVILALYQPFIGLASGILLAYLIYYSFTRKREEDVEFTSYIEGLIDEFDSATKHAIFNMPFPLVMIDEEGSISWYNTPFLKLMEDQEILGEKISSYILDLSTEEVFMDEEDRKENFLRVSHKEKNYQVYINLVDTKKTKSTNSRIGMLYWVDTTEYVELKETYDDEKTMVSLVYVDNYDDVKKGAQDINRPMLMAEIDKQISSYFTDYNGIVRKYENDKYLVITDKKALKDMKEKKFDLLDILRELDVGNNIPVTLSMGVGGTETNILESYKKARAAVDVALGRGGDQVVVQVGNSLNFYGGKTKAVEKRNKVKSRVIGYALRQLIDQSEEVYVMGHKNPDMDSFGAGIGILRAVADRNKTGYLILNDINPSIKNIYEKMKLEQPELLDHIITTEEALDRVKDESLLVVVDNHKPSFTEAPEMLDIIDKVVLFDHHRRGAEFIENPVLTYLEPYASSTCELVTEVLSYMSDKINLTKFEAEALLAGITVDTKNFSFQTGVRTFEAASILKRSGADTTVVRQLFRDDHDTFMYKAEVVKSSKIISDIIAIGRLESDMENSILIAAQSADELLSINGVEASFVMTYIDNRIHISGRSLGNISVQLILEKLGGGGHLTSAGAQIDGKTMDEVEEMLIEEINDYLEEGDAE